MKCQFCKSIFADKDELQLHQVSSCPAIEEDDFTEKVSEATFRWENNEMNINSPKTAHIILSDTDNQIEMNYSYSYYESKTVQMQPGNSNIMYICEY